MRIFLLSVVSVIALASCGGKATEGKSSKQDSIAKADSVARQDSLKNEKETYDYYDSIARVKEAKYKSTSGN